MYSSPICTELEETAPVPFSTVPIYSPQPGYWCSKTPRPVEHLNPLKLKICLVLTSLASWNYHCRHLCLWLHLYVYVKWGHQTMWKYWDTFPYTPWVLQPVPYHMNEISRAGIDCSFLVCRLTTADCACLNIIFYPRFSPFTLPQLRLNYRSVHGRVMFA